MPSSKIASTLSPTLRETIRPAPMVTQAIQGDETVLADFQAGRYYTLSAVGSRIWQLVREGITVPALLAQLRDEYDAPAEQVDADAIGFLRALRAAHLIVGEVS